MKTAAIVGAVLLCTIAPTWGQSSIKAKDRVVKVRSEVISATQVQISWTSETFATGFVVSRKPFGDNSTSDWSTIASLANTATSYTDTVPALNTAYEYRVTKNTSSGFTAYGYTACGIDVPVVHSRGKIVVVYTSTGAPTDAFKKALIADGWTPILVALTGTETVPGVRTLIKAQYDLDTSNVKAVLLLGHVPVPYSGLFSSDINSPTVPPDGHYDTHAGAWPADLYYGDMVTDAADWTDTGTQTTGINDDGRGSNSPGDGKFDTIARHSDVELEVGRVDFNGVAGSAYGIGETEAQAMSRYFSKDISYRNGGFTISRNGAVADYWQDYFDFQNIDLPDTTCLAASAWGNFPNFSATSSGLNITTILSYQNPLPVNQDKNYFRTMGALSTADLWSAAYGEGGALPFESLSYDFNIGKFYVGRSKDFWDFDPKTVFVMLGGSFIGDWDSYGDSPGIQGKPSMLRAAIGGPTYTLASMWVGRPHWFFHHMLIGETIGYSTRITQNDRPNGTMRYNGASDFAAGWTHLALMGDPTLRADIVKPPTGVNLRILNTSPSKTVSISWTHSADRGPGPGAAPGFRGYYVYRATSADGPYALRTSTPVTGTSYSETLDLGYPYYMVRACKSERFNSNTGVNKGVYDDLSAGVVAPIDAPIRIATVSNATGNWLFYPFLNGGGSQSYYTTTDSMNNYGSLVNPAPLPVYQKMEVEGGTLSWTAGFLSPSATYKVRVHLSSINFTDYWRVIERITVNAGNGVSVYWDMTPYTSGGFDQAFIVEFSQNFVPDSNGQITGTIAPTGTGTLGGVCGVEILKN